ncbi:hypothetical protein Pse7367_0787 [Thalassoporum mexicanum PCC 7367]|uniref:hypothetical protein n=1 Tax=Thalassoporum mexicanum TaxID=3457544 RepID=UPI00029FAC32|nr:hypothetical protein [Pseudanabaena sp. PCC 7367]AFY69087.1 hypothetical protein Pse7367_0787 [Pseudanabaena sp. PCC 7367]
MTANSSGQFKRLPYAHLLLLVAFFVAIGFLGAVPTHQIFYTESAEGLVFTIFAYLLLTAIGSVVGNFARLNENDTNDTGDVIAFTGFVIGEIIFIVLISINHLLSDYLNPHLAKYNQYFPFEGLEFALFAGLLFTYICSSSFTITAANHISKAGIASLLLFDATLVILTPSYLSGAAVVGLMVLFYLSRFLFRFTIRFISNSFTENSYQNYAATLFIIYTIAFGLGTGVLIKQGQINMFSAVSVFGIGGILLIAIVHDINRRIRSHAIAR